MSILNPGVGYAFTRTSSGSHLEILQPWSRPIIQTASDSVYPFQVTDLGKKTGVDEWYFSVEPGLVNNINPMIEGTSWYMNHMPVSDWQMVYYKWNFNPTSHYSYIVLKLGYDSSTKKYPDDNTSHVSASPSYPVVASLTFMPTTDDTDSYIVLATAYQDPTTKAITVWQAVTGSLWTDRIKVGSNAATYYFAKV